jgi:hypothetical protein
MVSVLVKNVVVHVEEESNCICCHFSMQLYDRKFQIVKDVKESFKL